MNLVDSNQQALDKAKKGIEVSIQRVAKKKHADDAAAQKKLIEGVIGKINTSTSVAESVKSSDLVIEAIVENIDVKRKLFAEVEANVPK